MINFLPEHIKSAINHLNYNLLTEIRLREGHPVIIEYGGEYNYIDSFGVTKDKNYALICQNVDSIFTKAIDGDVFRYVEQIKNGFITVNNGVRIGIAGEYVTGIEGVRGISGITSLNVRIPHEIKDCSNRIFESIFNNEIASLLIFSRPGLGKTTILRDLTRKLSAKNCGNILVFDERREISAIDAGGKGYDLGERVDVVRCSDKLSAIASAIRAMKPNIIVTDELYGENDWEAVKYAWDCKITVIASTHICNKDLLKTLGFDYYAELVKIGCVPIIYDKNFNTTCNNNSIDGDRNTTFG